MSPNGHDEGRPIHFGWLLLVVLPGLLILIFLGWRKLWLLPIWVAGLWLFFFLVSVWEDHTWWKFSDFGEPSVGPCPRCGEEADYRTRGERYKVRCPMCGLSKEGSAI